MVNRVAKIAAKLKALSEYDLDVWINADPEKTRKTIRALAAAVLGGQAFVPASPQQRKSLLGKLGRHKVRVKAEGFDRVLMGPVEFMKPPRKSP